MKFKWTAEKSLFLTFALTAAMLLMTVCGLFAVPAMSRWYSALSGHGPAGTVLGICLYLSLLAGIAALCILLKMLSNIAKQKMFVEENARCLRLVSWCCFFLAAIWLFLGWFRFIALCVGIIAAFAGLVVRVMRNLLETAIAMREEQDYTI